MKILIQRQFRDKSLRQGFKKEKSGHAVNIFICILAGGSD